MNATAAVRDDREFRFSDREFEYLRTVVKDSTGINLSDAKRELVYSRLAKRLRLLKLGGFAEYCELLQNDDGEETACMVNAITTNLTSFFRENHHFEFLSSQALPALMRDAGVSRRLRVWSAGCSTGPEPYSVAMAISEVLPSTPHWDVKILATDLDTDVLRQAGAGVFTDDKLKGVSDQRRRRWFLRGTGANAGKVRVNSRLRELVAFKQLNLMSEWPMTGPFDVIFCRNVMIYFDKPTQRLLVDRFARLLSDNGYLFLGHSESLHNVSERFRLIGTTIYQKQT